MGGVRGRGGGGGGIGGLIAGTQSGRVQCPSSPHPESLFLAPEGTGHLRGRGNTSTLAIVAISRLEQSLCMQITHHDLLRSGKRAPACTSLEVERCDVMSTRRTGPTQYRPTIISISPFFIIYRHGLTRPTHCIRQADTPFKAHLSCSRDIHVLCPSRRAVYTWIEGNSRRRKEETRSR